MVQPANQLRHRLGTCVRALRLVQGWSQERLGEASGLSYKFLGEVERGVANPSIDTLQALASAFKVDVTDLFGGATDRAAVLEYPVTREQAATAREALNTLEGLIRNVSPATRAGARKERRYRRQRRTKR